MIARLLSALLLLGIFLGSIFGWKYYQAGQAAAQQKPPPPATVTAVKVTVETWPNQLFAIGTVTTDQGIQVKTEVSGIIHALHFESGQRVNQGALLAELDDTVDRAELAGLIAEHQLARIEFERVDKLHRDGSAARSNRDQAKAVLDNAAAKVTAKQARIAQKQIKAPFAGQLGLRQVSIGTYLAEGDPVVLLQATQPIQVDFSLPERYLTQVHLKQPITLTVQAYSQTFEGQITAIQPLIDVNSRNAILRATLPNREGLLYPGMAATIYIQQPDQPNLLTLPRAAITFNPYGASVFVVTQKDNQSMAEQRQIETGREYQQRIAITKGLSAGELVVHTGHVKLRNGQAIQVVDAVSTP